MGLNELDQKVIAYLSEDGHADRRRALIHMMEQGIFGNPWTSQTKTSLAAYCDTNALEFCKEGIAKFREAFNLPVPKPVITEAVVEVVLRITTTSNLGSNQLGYVSASGHTGFGLGRSLTEHIKYQIQKVNRNISYPFDVKHVEFVSDKLIEKR